MTVAFDVAGLDAASNFGVTSCTTASFTVAGTANRAALMILGMAGNTSTGFTSSCGGVSGSAIAGTDSGSNVADRILAHGVIAPPSGAQTATMSWTTAQDALLQVLVFNGVDQTAPFINGSVAFGATGSPTVTASGSGAGNMSASGANGFYNAVTGGQTTRVPVESNGSHQLTSATHTSGSTHSWADGFAEWAALAVHVQAPTAASATTLVGPVLGRESVQSSDFTVGADGTITGTVNVTPSDGGAGGSFSPSSVAISSGTPTGTFRYTPPSGAATRTISISDDGGLTDAASIAFVVQLATDPKNPRNLFVDPRAREGRNHRGGSSTYNEVSTVLKAYLFGEPASGAQSITPSGIASAEAFGTLKVNRTVILAGISSGEVFGTLSASTSGGGQSITGLTGIASAEAFGAPSVRRSLTSTGIASAEAFGTLKVNRNVRLAGIASTEAFGTILVDQAGGPQFISPVGITSGEAFGDIVVQLEVGSVVVPPTIGQGDGPRAGVGRIHSDFPHRTAFNDEPTAKPSRKPPAAPAVDVPRETEPAAFPLAESYAEINRAIAVANEMAAIEAHRAIERAQQEAKRLAAIKAILIAIAVADDD